jgi:hypothetical protein
MTDHLLRKHHSSKERNRSLTLTIGLFFGGHLEQRHRRRVRQFKNRAFGAASN